MNPIRLVLAILVAFVAKFFSDFLIHGFWLKDTYLATARLWRPEAEMQNYFGWLMLGQFLAAFSFTVLWAMGFAQKARLMCAVMFGLFMALFNQAHTFISYAVQPMPLSLVLKWFVAGIFQGMFIGALLYFVYKPRPAPPTN